MPEGPEIRRAADQLRRILEGKLARRVRFAPDKFPALQKSGKALSGRTITGVEPRGKAMLTHFDAGLTIYSHNQLYGEWQVFEGEAPDTHLQTRLTIETATHTAVLYSASDIAVLKTNEVLHHPYIAKLGIELLDPAVTLEDVYGQVNQVRFARRNLATLLLDQGFLAGIGNYLRSDILFVARLHPDARLGDLSATDRRRLARTALTLTRRSYTTGGITNDPKRAARLKTQGMPFGRYRHWVFDRDDESCHICDHLIRRIDVGGRGLYLCEHCQPPNPRISSRKSP